MHYMDLKVLHNGEEQVMRFLLTDIRWEDLIFGYPWLATYQPTINWCNATINTKLTPTILQTLKITPLKTTIAKTLTEETKDEIIQELELEEIQA